MYVNGLTGPRSERVLGNWEMTDAETPSWASWLA